MGGQKTRLLVVNGTLNAQEYINQVLVPEVVPFIQRNAQIVTLQQDNARPHTARLTQHFLQRNNIIVLPWPANSPDLNPIEHIWDKLGKDIWNQQISNIRDLETALQGAWASRFLDDPSTNHSVHNHPSPDDPSTNRSVHSD